MSGTIGSAIGHCCRLVDEACAHYFNFVPSCGPFGRRNEVGDAVASNPNLDQDWTLSALPGLQASQYQQVLSLASLMLDNGSSSAIQIIINFQHRRSCFWR